MIRAERVIFNKVGWMLHYGAQEREDPPVGGGAYNDTHHEGACEVVNFMPWPDGRAYGLIHAATLDVRRLGAEPRASFQLGCTVVTVAPHPDGGQVVVGWQARAEVMRARRPKDPYKYNYRAPMDAAVLLPHEARTFQIPRGVGGMGQSMMVYAADDSGQLRPWAAEAVELMRAYDGPNLLRTEAH